LIGQSSLKIKENEMKQLEDIVLEQVQDFVKNQVLFTALDVSNVVKLAAPFARHRAVRDIVRSLFTNEIETAGYARTPITVTLADSTKADALLYHPLADSWDLDSKYDAQKRTRSTAAPTVVINSPPPVVSAPVVVAPVVPPPPPAPVSTRDLWNSLFQSQPSLFPSK
jgi:hypothetical protein